MSPASRGSRKPRQGVNRPIRINSRNLTWPSLRGWFDTGSSGEIRRRIICLAITLGLLLWPSPQLMFKPFTVFASDLNYATHSTASGFASVISSLMGTPVIEVPIAPYTTVSVPMPFQLSAPAGREQGRDLTMAERSARVSSINVAPHRFVGYIGESMTFVAMGATMDGKPANGARFTWQSSDETKLTIDESGRARLLRPGPVSVTVIAGSAQKTTPVLIRATRRRPQTDDEWRADQDSLVGDGRPETGDGIGVLGKVIDRLMPTAYAQFNTWGDNPNAAGQIGTPPFTALEDTRLGPVMPGSNFELPIPIVSLGGRGLATSLMLYYNSNVWGAYFDPVGNTNVYAFDPIQSWPSPGFSLGFGRITYTNTGSGYRYMLIDPNGTRHDLGVGSDTGTNTLQTTDGSHATYAGNALGGTLYFNDGTAVTIDKVNNRLLPTQITDTNGNYIQIAYHWETGFPPMAINYIVDTLGRVIQFNYGESPAPSSTSLSSISTPTGTVTLGYQTVTMNYNYALGNRVENAPTSFSAVSTVTIPQRPTYGFTYSGYGMIYDIVATSQGGTEGTE